MTPTKYLMFLIVGLIFPSTTPEILIIQGDSLLNADKYLQAIRIYQSAADLFEQGNNINDAADIYYDKIGLKQYYRGKYQNALNSWETALQLYRNDNDLYGESDALNRIGIIYKKLGMYTNAQENYLKSLSLAEKLDYQKRIGTCLNNLGNVYRQLGDYYKSIEYYNKSLLAIQKKEDTESWSKERAEAETWLMMATTFNRMGDHGKAMIFLENSENVFRNFDLKRNLITALHLKGSMLGIIHQFDSSLYYYQQSLELAKEIGKIESQCLNLLDIGRIFIRINKYPDALEYLNRALSIADEYDLLLKKQIIYSYLGIYYNATSDDPKAIEYFKKSIDLIEEVRSGLSIETQQIGFLKSRLDSYRRLIKILIFSKQYEEAFKYMEKMKARALLDILEGGKVDFKQSMDEEELFKEKALNAELEFINNKLKLSDNSESGIIDSLTSIQQQVRFDLEQFTEGLYFAHPELKEFRGLGRTLDLRRAKRMISRDEAVIYYFLYDPIVYEEFKIDIIIVTKEGITHKQQSGKIVEEFYTEMDKLTSSVAKGFPKWIDSSSSTIYSALIKPIKTELEDKKRICIIPEGNLNYIPFQALKNEDTNKYLIEDYAIYYTPSLSTLLWLRSFGTYGGRELFALGDPVFEEIAEVEMAMRSNLTPLPASRDEVLALEEIYYPHAEVLLSEETSESNFKNNASDYGIIHIASHALIEENSPMYSSIAFSNEENEDGFLEAREIINLELNADLIVLSACKTASGHIMEGEGMMGLTRAFFTAGVPSVVASLWNVADNSTRDLMVEFHTYLREGERPAIALQKAQIHMLTKSSNKDPIFWAPFILIGDSE